MDVLTCQAYIWNAALEEQRTAEKMSELLAPPLPAPLMAPQAIDPPSMLALDDGSDMGEADERPLDRKVYYTWTCAWVQQVVGNRP